MKKLTYKTGNYDAWADSLWNRGYKTPLEDIANLLNISKRWLESNLDVNYVVYTKTYIYKKRSGNQTRRVDLEEVSNWIINNAEFEAQTEIIDLYSYLANANKHKADTIYKEYRKTFDRLSNFYNLGTIPESILDLVRKNYHISSGINKNVNVIDRPKHIGEDKVPLYPWKPVERFNIFDYEFMFPHNNGLTPELNYREAFLKGWVKVSLGKRIIFVKKDYPIDKMKMPMIIKYGTKVIVK